LLTTSCSGLGVGTTPSAFVTHGINTTVVEIDRAVYELAAKYFQLKENNPPVIADAVSYTAGLAASAPETYDYIVHDVFTGGAEPVDLFTLEFFQGLGALLKPDGIVAIVSFPPRPTSTLLADTRRTMPATSTCRRQSSSTAQSSTSSPRVASSASRPPRPRRPRATPPTSPTWSSFARRRAGRCGSAPRLCATTCRARPGRSFCT